MHPPFLAPRSRRLVLAAPLVFLALSTALFADAGRREGGHSGTCYCRCTEGHTHAGCVRMCDLPKYASRWWATSCAKPRLKTPAAAPGAGPRLPHADRAEHAKVETLAR